MPEEGVRGRGARRRLLWLLGAGGRRGWSRGGPGLPASRARACEAAAGGRRVTEDVALCSHDSGGTFAPGLTQVVGGFRGLRSLTPRRAMALLPTGHHAALPLAAEHPRVALPPQAPSFPFAQGPTVRCGHRAGRPRRMGPTFTLPGGGQVSCDKPVLTSYPPSGPLTETKAEVALGRPSVWPSGLCSS